MGSRCDPSGEKTRVALERERERARKALLRLNKPPPAAAAANGKKKRAVGEAAVVEDEAEEGEEEDEGEMEDDHDEPEDAAGLLGGDGGSRVDADEGPALMDSDDEAAIEDANPAPPPSAAPAATAGAKRARSGEEEEEDGPPAKRARVEAEEHLSQEAAAALAAATMEVEQREPTLDEIAADPKNWWRICLELMALERKYVAADFLKIRSNDKTRKSRFAPDIAPTLYPSEYDYLREHDPGYLCDALLIPYYDGKGERLRGNIPDGALAAAMAGDTEKEFAFESAWTMASALACANPDVTTFGFRDPNYYYPDLVPPGEGVDELPDSYFRPGAPAPKTFPHEGRYVMVVNTTYLYPEILRRAPLPYALNFPVTPILYTAPDILALVHEVPAFFSHIERSSNGLHTMSDLGQAFLNEISPEQREALMALLDEEEQRLPELTAAEVNRLGAWATARGTHIKQLLNAQVRRSFFGPLTPEAGGTIQGRPLPRPPEPKRCHDRGNAARDHVRPHHGPQGCARG